MFRRLTSFILVVCFLNSFLFTSSMTSVSAEETQNELEGIEQGFSPGDGSSLEFLKI